MKTARSFSFILSCLLFHLHSIPTAGYYYYPTTTTTATNEYDNEFTSATTQNDNAFIRTSCKTTLYPDLCYTTLSAYSNAVQQDPAQLARVAVGISLLKAKNMAIYFYNLTRQADYGSPHQATAALHDCFSVFGDAVDQIRGSLKQMRKLRGNGESVRFQMSNVQTWMSAALTNEDTCTDGLEEVADVPMRSDVSDKVLKVKEVTSNALALVNRYAQKIIVP